MLIYEDQPAVAWWYKFLLGGLLTLTTVLGIVFIRVDMVGAAIMFGTTVFDGLLFFCITPRKLQIHSDRLVIVLGGPFAKTVQLSDIKSVNHTSGNSALAYPGMRFATSTGYVVEILRKSGMSVLISPTSREFFIDQLNQALKSAPQ
jgi:hypothetical protein